MSTEQPQRIVVTPTKSVGIALLLSGVFGPLGIFYSTIWGAVLMLLVSTPVAFFTLGIGLVITWPIGMLWAGLAANAYNKKLLAGQPPRS